MSIIIWWLFATVLGAGFLPLAGYVFQKFEDRGWIFSKCIGLLVSSMVFFWLNSMHWLKFVQRNLLIVTVMLIALNMAALFYFKLEKVFDGINFRLVVVEEALFLGIYLIWVWIIGFRPEAYGTEKFMDYAFLTSMMRSLWMPFEDMWYSGKAINYYYGGQYVTVWMVKLTGVDVGMGYNLMRALVATVSFCAPFSLVWQIMQDRFGRKGKEAPWVAATIAGWSVAFCGNVHYIIYGIIKPLVYKMRGDEYNYWFPDSTRYIGYDPDLPDKTIHEYPAYSTVLGDLHAHYLDILFVVAATAIAYAYMQKILHRVKNANGKLPRLTTKSLLIEILAQPEIILIGFFTGMFRFTNYWDFPIYFVVCGSMVFFMNLWMYKGDIVRFLIVMAGQALEAFVIGYVACLPFTMTFDQISTEIGVTHSHTVFYQFMILWGLPIVVLAGFLIMIVREQLEWKAARAAAGKTADGIGDAVRADTAEDAAFANALLEVGFSDGTVASGGAEVGTAAALQGAGTAAAEEGMVMENTAGSSEMSGQGGGAEAFAKEKAGAGNAASQAAGQGGAAAFAQGKSEAGYATSQVADQGGAATFAKEKAGAGGDADVGEDGALLADTEDGDRVFLGLHLSDLAIILIGLCALGLILMPEFIYVKDIYGAEHYRANTMFKLTYQAFILFGMMMGYVVERCYLRGKRIARVFSIIALVVIVLTAGYIVRSVNSWFGNILKPSGRISTDASVFVDQSFHTDFDAICWLNNTVTGRPVVLEAPGDSYTDYERVSVATGLPTILGWYVHEWLWRNNLEAQNARVADAQTIYTSTDEEEVRRLIKKYKIVYIYIGQLERQKYPDLNDSLLQSLGQVAYSDGETTYIMKVQ
ncbi:MAG: DUF2298 domain-containing protein [Lachnospiraceae bacterium]|nr:DUF2298 domain-containing protein [Lachnospiraceae bacterium]